MSGQEETHLLVVKAQKGDRVAFEALVRQHYRLVYGLSLSAVGDWSVAEDIAQDAFLVAWTHLGKLRNAGAFSMWLRKITRNLALNWRRSAQYRRSLAQRYDETATSGSSQPAEGPEAVRVEERRETVWKALSVLRAPIREAMVMFYLEGRSVAEAARLLEISENALKLRLHTGRKQLKAYFEQQLESQLAMGLEGKESSDAARHILAGMAAGPALPQLGHEVSRTGFSLWTHYFVHEGIPNLTAALSKGSLVVSAKKASIVALVFALGIGGIYWTLTRNGSPTAHQEAPAQTVTSSPDPGRDRILPAGERSRSTERHKVQLASSNGSEDIPIPLNKPGGDKPNASAESTTAFTVVGATVAAEGLAALLEAAAIQDPQRYASISGTVYDTRGNPVPGAVVSVLALGVESGQRSSLVGLSRLAITQGTGYRYTAESGADGGYTVSGIRYKGNARVTAYAEGFSLTRESNTFLALKEGDHLANVDLVLEPGGALRGILLSPEGEPVSDGIVSVVSYHADGIARTGWLDTATTDGNGYFALGLIRPGKASLVTTSATYGQASFVNVPVGAPEPVELQMDATAVLSGTVTWSDGRPAEGAYVFLEGKSDDGEGIRRVPASTAAGRVDAQGHYSIAGIDANQAYTAIVVLETGTPVSQPETLSPFSPGDVGTWDHVIQDFITIAGHVYGKATGRPLADVKVACLQDGVPVDNAEAVTGPDGSYELTLYSGPGTYWIYPRLWRIDPIQTGFEDGREVVLQPGQTTTVDLTFMDTVTMSIRVVDASGAPLEGLTLGIHEGSHTWVPVGETLSDGCFAWAGFAPGVESNFVVFRGRNVVGQTHPVAGDPGQVFSEEVVPIFGDAGLEAVLQQDDGTPLANRTVTIQVIYALDREIQREVNTDAQGHFAVNSGLPATETFLTFRCQNDSGSGTDMFQWSSNAVELVDGKILNIGTVTMGSGHGNETED